MSIVCCIKVGDRNRQVFYVQEWSPQGTESLIFPMYFQLKKSMKIIPKKFKFKNVLEFIGSYQKAERLSFFTLDDKNMRDLKLNYLPSYQNRKKELLVHG